MTNEIHNNETNETARFKIVAERAFWWNFLVNVFIVITLILINTFKPNNHTIPTENLIVILNFMLSTTYIFAGTYILKFLGSDGKALLGKLSNFKNIITTEENKKGTVKK